MCYVMGWKQELACGSIEGLFLFIQNSGGSRISHRGGVHPLGRGVDLRHGHFSVKMYVKTKELGPIGGACAGHAPLDPPMHNETFTESMGMKGHGMGKNLNMQLLSWLIPS